MSNILKLSDYGQQIAKAVMAKAQMSFYGSKKETTVIVWECKTPYLGSHEKMIDAGYSYLQCFRSLGWQPAEAQEKFYTLRPEKYRGEVWHNEEKTYTAIEGIYFWEKV